VTRDELETVMWRAGLTLPQVADLLAAADTYATAQARAAIDAGLAGRKAGAP
jgi:hypothetical protein